MPLAAEMDVFNTEVGSDQEIRAWGNPQDGAVVANAAHHCPIVAGLGQAANAFNQLSLRLHQGLTISKTTAYVSSPALLGAQIVPWQREPHPEL